MNELPFVGERQQSRQCDALRGARYRQWIDRQRFCCRKLEFKKQK